MGCSSCSNNDGKIHIVRKGSAETNLNKNANVVIKINRKNSVVNMTKSVVDKRRI